MNNQFNNPTPDQVQKVIDTLRLSYTLVDQRACRLDMDETKVKVYHEGYDIHDNPCETVACHAGHFLIGSLLMKGVSSDYLSLADAIDAEVEEFRNQYMAGVAMMTGVLGFESSNHLTAWADANPAIWGNRRGGLMFANKSAFLTNDQLDSEIGLEDIIEHWVGVLERIEADRGAASLKTNSPHNSSTAGETTPTGTPSPMLLSRTASTTGRKYDEA